MLLFIDRYQTGVGREEYTYPVHCPTHLIEGYETTDEIHIPHRDYILILFPILTHSLTKVLFYQPKVLFYQMENIGLL